MVQQSVLQHAQVVQVLVRVTLQAVRVACMADPLAVMDLCRNFAWSTVLTTVIALKILAFHAMMSTVAWASVLSHKLYLHRGKCNKD